MIENDFNEILGNEIIGSGFDGVGIFGRNRLAGTGNKIGGDTPWSENEISFSGRDGVLIGGVEGSENEVARDHGASNGGPFIEFRDGSPRLEPVGPNGGITPPLISSVTAGDAGGSAEPGATVRVFRKAGNESGELESFLGQAVANPQGVWQVSFGLPIPAGTDVAATQTNVEGGTSELSFGATPGPPAKPEPAARATPVVRTKPASGGNTIHSRSTAPPQTKIVKGPGSNREATATFSFRSSEPGSTFECRLDKTPFRSCKAPIVYRNLAPGRHRFEVKAIDDTGIVDPTPARRTFVIRHSKPQ